MREYIEANLADQMLITSEESIKTSSKLLENGKVAMIVVMDDTGNLASEFDHEIVETSSTEDSPCMLLQSLLSNDHRLVKIVQYLSNYTKFIRLYRKLTVIYTTRYLGLWSYLNLGLELFFAHI